MTQIDPKNLDYSQEMKAYFHHVTAILVDRFNRSSDEARDLVDRYFALEVDPLERAFLMHTEADDVAAALATGDLEQRRSL